MENGHLVQDLASRAPDISSRRQTLARATPLQQDILRVLSYFDIFRHPLTAEELYAFLPSNSTTPYAVARACQTEPLASLLTHQEGYFHLGGDSSEVVQERRTKEARARKHWRVASFMTSVIRHFPFVRGVFISGELAKGVASLDGDVDFVIVTENDRLWICRTLLIAFKKIGLLNNKKFFCLNHLMTERNLTVSERSVYTAVEVVTLKPMLNNGLFEAYIRANGWTSSFLPNFVTETATETHRRRSLLQRVLEGLFPTRAADLLDLRLMEFWKSTWKKRYSHLSDEKRETIFHCSRDLSTAYNGDFSSKILNSYHSRLAQFGLHG